ncbi:hypothetical protein, partial [Bradyrhizobium japonicum]|uniref:hypothetical protein n=1 Tax=Bradyrhizobium japonicum TaxID=375 RepID=UPI001AEBC5A4
VERSVKLTTRCPLRLRSTSLGCALKLAARHLSLEHLYSFAMLRRGFRERALRSPPSQYGQLKEPVLISRYVSSQRL